MVGGRSGTGFVKPPQKPEKRRQLQLYVRKSGYSLSGGQDGLNILDSVDCSVPYNHELLKIHNIVCSGTKKPLVLWLSWQSEILERLSRSRVPDPSRKEISKEKQSGVLLSE